MLFNELYFDFKSFFKKKSIFKFKLTSNCLTFLILDY